MTTKEKIYEQYRSRGHVSGGELYMSFDVAFDFVQDCTRQDIAIIGLEFFHIENKYVIPVSPLNGCDLSSFLEVHKAWKGIVLRCNQFISKVLREEKLRDASQYCNFVIFDKLPTE